MELTIDNEIEVPSLIDPFKNDKFDRKLEVDNLVNIISNLNKPHTIAINGKWGSGKTTFVRLLEAQLNIANIKVSYFNAWEKDFDKDPFVLILNHILNQFSEKKDIKVNIKKTGLKILRTLLITTPKFFISKYFHDDLFKEEAEFLKDIAPESLEFIFDSINKEKDLIKELQTDLTALASTHNKIVIIIDELDRCKPTFSIELLERIKHIFRTENLIFVLATDLVALGNAVSGVYGSKYDGRLYLERFFDIEYNLKYKNPKDFWMNLVSKFSGQSEVSKMVTQGYLENHALWLVNQTQLTPREMSKFFARLQVSLLSCDEELMVFVMLLTILKLFKNDVYEDIKNNDVDINKIVKAFNINRFIYYDNEGNDNDFHMLACLANLLKVIDEDSISKIDQKNEKYVSLINTNPENRNIVGLFCQKNENRISYEGFSNALSIVDFHVEINYLNLVQISNSITVSTSSAKTISSN